jgi:hypothetical protein
MFRKPWYCSEGSTGHATGNIVSTFDLIFRMTVLCNFDTVYFCGLAPMFRRNLPDLKVEVNAVKLSIFVDYVGQPTNSQGDKYKSLSYLQHPSPKTENLYGKTMLRVAEVTPNESLLTANVKYTQLQVPSLLIDRILL